MHRDINSFYLNSTDWSPVGELFNKAIYEAQSQQKPYTIVDFSDLKGLNKTQLIQALKDINIDLAKLSPAYVLKSESGKPDLQAYGHLKLEIVDYENDYRNLIPVLALTVRNLSQIRKRVFFLRPDDFDHYKIFDLWNSGPISKPFSSN